MKIFNANGAEWQTFSLQPSEADYYLPKLGGDFRPLCCDSNFPLEVLLRVKSESEHWLEVEVNESTRLTKYVPKDVKMWSKATWGFWIYYSNYIVVDFNRCRPRISAEGKIDEKIEDKNRQLGLSTSKAWVMSVSGEWAYVSFGTNPNGNVCSHECGWVRWKDGREILVGSLYNGYKIPTVDSDREY
ncbi:MAG: hypothetical protein IPN69_08950 [Acidobacteria bacterium]|nr:hypothetical protein [Acidobacteriota bacterium]